MEHGFTCAWAGNIWNYFHYLSISFVIDDVIPYNSHIIYFTNRTNRIQQLQKMQPLWRNPRSRGTTKRRHFRTSGDRSQKCVRIANRIARRIAYLLEYHVAKGTFYVLENPLSSLLWKYKAIRSCLKRHGAKRVVVHLGAYGANTSKPVFRLN